MPSMTLEKEEQLQIRPASEHVGADITDVNLPASLSNGAFEKIEDAYNRYSLLIFRDQELSPAQQIAFARRFGELEISPRAQFALPGYPEILVLSNIIEDGKPIGNADAGRLGTRKPRGITFRTRRIPHLSRLRAEAAGDAHRRGARCGCVALWRQRDARRQCGGRLEHAQRRHLRLCGQTIQLQINHMYMLTEALRRSYCASSGARHEDPHAEGWPGDETSPATRRGGRDRGLSVHSVISASSRCRSPDRGT